MVRIAFLRTLRWSFGLACLLLAAPAWAGGIAPDLQRQLQANPSSTEPTRVIVRYRDGSLLDSTLLLLRYGARLLDDLPLLGGSLVELSLGKVDDLAADPAVEWVSPDRLLRLQADWDVETVGADRVWSAGYQGGGVRIAVLDTGVDLGPGTRPSEWARSGGGSRIVGWKDFVNGRLSPYDDHGHGTHVAGIALGGGAASNGRISGTAPGAELVALKVLAADGSGRASTVIRAIQWCIQNRSAYGIRVLNLSFGHRPGESADTDPLCVAVRRAVRAGLVVVCSAGNVGKDSSGRTLYGGISSPGIEPAAITVGALNTRETADRSDDTVCTFSSRGPTYMDRRPKPDLLAPGNRIVSVRAPGSALDTAWPANRVDADPSTPESVDYFRLSGTSMAAPQVAGVAALLLQVNPALPPNAVKAILMYTAEPLLLRGADGNPLSPGLSLLTQGAGSLNALGAVELALRLDGAAPVGARWLFAPPSGRTEIGGHAFDWRGAILWGDQLSSGEGLFGYRQAAWENQYLWGDQYVWGDGVEARDSGISAETSNWESQAAWNEAAVWNDQYLWGDQYVWGDGDEAQPPPTDPTDPSSSDPPPSSP